MIFKVISHFILNKTQLIKVSSNIIFSENLAKYGRVWQKKRPLSAEETEFFEFLLYTTKFTSGTLSNSGYSLITRCNLTAKNFSRQFNLPSHLIEIIGLSQQSN